MRLAAVALTFLVGFMLCRLAWAEEPAALAIRSVENASYSSLTWPFTISGSIAGNTCINSDMCSTCELASCWQRPLCACATKRITDRAVVRVNLTRTKGIEGNALVSLPAGGNFPLVTANNKGDFVDMRWGDLCRRMGSSCEEFSSFNNSMTLRLSIDTNFNGIVDSTEPFILLTIRLVNPGTTAFNIFGTPNEEGVSGFKLEGQDQSLQFAMLNVHNAFPSLSYGARALGLRVFLSKESLLKATPQEADQVVDLKLIDINNIESVVLGLENGQRYFVRLAVMDDGGGLSQFYPGLKNLPASCTSNPDDSCPYAARAGTSASATKATPQSSGTFKRLGLAKR